MFGCVVAYIGVVVVVAIVTDVVDLPMNTLMQNNIKTATGQVTSATIKQHPNLS